MGNFITANFKGLWIEGVVPRGSLPIVVPSSAFQVL